MDVSQGGEIMVQKEYGISHKIKVLISRDTKLRKSMNVEPVRLNVRAGSMPSACYSCRPTPAHYKETGMKLVKDLLDQKIITAKTAEASGARPHILLRNPEESPWHFAWWWIFLLNDCLIRD